jgi:soluble lytic murein transglycosylase-like protein
MKKLALTASLAAFVFAPCGAESAKAQNYEALIAMHAAANGVPVSLVKRVMMRESRGNARAVSKGNYGLMQIRLQTARGVGYTGSAAGLLDANTNLTYAVKYLAGAYRVAGGNEARAIAYYQSGYYYAAKRQGANDRGGRYASLTQASLRDAASLDVAPAAAPARLAVKRKPARAANPFAALFSPQTGRR